MVSRKDVLLKRTNIKKKTIEKILGFVKTFCNNFNKLKKNFRNLYTRQFLGLRRTKLKYLNQFGQITFTHLFYYLYHGVNLDGTTRNVQGK